MTALVCTCTRVQGRKVVSFLFDVSASMFRFNGLDSRLLRACECAVMVMEAAADLTDRLLFEVAGHNGGDPALNFCEFGAPPADEKERFKVVQRMIASAQYCEVRGRRETPPHRAAARSAALVCSSARRPRPHPRRRFCGRRLATRRFRR